MSLGWEVQGLALAAVIVSIVEVAILFFIMSRRIKGLFDRPFISAVARMLSAAGFIALITYGMVTWLPLNASDQSFFASFPKFALIAAVSLGSYLLISYAFRLKEATTVVERILKILFKRPKVDHEPRSHS
jgi:peptidoglycan biosynthesis protein MviN/MurJ (putative lipid II flippase)